MTMKKKGIIVAVVVAVPLVLLLAFGLGLVYVNREDVGSEDRVLALPRERRDRGLTGRGEL